MIIWNVNNYVKSAFLSCVDHETLVKNYKISWRLRDFYYEIFAPLYMYFCSENFINVLYNGVICVNNAILIVMLCQRSNIALVTLYCYSFKYLIM